MAACRCSTCGISFPTPFDMFDMFGDGECGICLVCGGGTDRMGGEQPDADWREKVEQRTKDHFRTPQEKKAAEEGPFEDMPRVKAHVRVEGGEMFVLMWDVFPVVGYRLRDGDLFVIGKQVFEVLGYIEQQREYHVRPFSLTLSDEDLARLVVA